jgi:hypothetical protein
MDLAHDLIRMNDSPKISETDLCEPIRRWLIQQGYTVRSEVRHCDVAARKGDELIVIEMKCKMNVTLLIQAAQRQKITDSVYVAIPRPKESLRTKHWKQIEHLLKRLELGLIVVSLGGDAPQIEILFHPMPLTRQKSRKKKRAILQEMEGRLDDFNQGGSVRRKLITAYRESAVFIACCLEKFGPMRPVQLRRLGTGPKTQAILYNNHYGWFDRIGEGVYALKSSALQELSKYPEIAEHYRKRIEESPS